MATELIKKLKNSQHRTLFLAVFAAAVFVWSAIYIFDIDSQLMYKFFLMCLLLLVVVVVLAFFLSVGLVLLKKRNSDRG